MQIVLSCIKSFFLIGIIAWLVACGGGGSGSSSSDSDSDSSSSETFTISGRVATTANPGGEVDVTVKGFYSGSSATAPSTMTAADGSYTLTVERDRSVSIQFSKPGFITLNMETLGTDSDITGFGPTIFATTAYVQGAIDTVTGGAGISIASKGWLIARAVDGMGNEVNGVSITSTVAPEAEAYILCDGTDSGGSATTGAPCPPPGRDVMYGAYFSAATLPTETDVDVLGEVHKLPIRLGEISTYN